MPQAASVSYNLACVYAAQNKKDKAVTSIKNAISKGYDNVAQLLSDQDPASLRDTDHHKKLNVNSDNQIKHK